MRMTPKNLAGLIDHTLLKPEATNKDIGRLCTEAKLHGFYSVCINPYWVPFCKTQLQKTGVKICSVIGFPLGATSMYEKAHEPGYAVTHGADEIDVVINIGALKSDQIDLINQEIEAIKSYSYKAAIKAIIETCLLTPGEIILACQIAKAFGINFIKTSTGFNGRGASTADIELIRSVVGPKMGIKASGGIKTYRDALSMLEAGATRLGCSASVKIIEECKEENKGKAKGESR